MWCDSFLTLIKELKKVEEQKNLNLDVTEEIEIEDLAIDGICGVY